VFKFHVLEIERGYNAYPMEHHPVAPSPSHRLTSIAEYLAGMTYKDMWERGEDYVKKGKVVLTRSDMHEAEGAAKGQSRYDVYLKFVKSGMRRRCTCPYGQRSTSRTPVCKHMIALAILWDDARGIPRLTEEKKDILMPPPLVTREQLEACYRDPLHADLDVLRLAPDEFALSPRGHAHLPKMPAFTSDSMSALTLKEVQGAFRTMKRWSYRSSYDPYFCAGEMVAACCEVMRVICTRINATSPLVCAEILREAQEFHYTLITGLIDDSEGTHIFTESHLEEMHWLLRRRELDERDRQQFDTMLREYERSRGRY